MTTPTLTTLFPDVLVDPMDEGEVTTDPAVMVALDAIREGRALTPELVVGLPATVSINGDSYAARITKVSSSLHTITVERTLYGSTRMDTFRWSAKLGRYRSAGGKHGSYALTVGRAVEARDPSF